MCPPLGLMSLFTAANHTRNGKEAKRHIFVANMSPRDMCPAIQGSRKRKTKPVANENKPADGLELGLGLSSATAQDNSVIACWAYAKVFLP